MLVAASTIFDFIERQESGTIERYEFASAGFGHLRRNLRQIVSKLRDSDDQEALNISDQLRTLLSLWLTVPVTFDNSIFDAVVDVLGPVGAVQARWGSDISKLYDTVRRAAEDLPLNDNPLRGKLREIIHDLRSDGLTFKIYCHRRARIYFESLLFPPMDAPFPENTFLHSVRDYRETSLFDVLLKVGPLRARGWGSAPDALLNAPRFSTLMQIVWSNCADDPDFGYDPCPHSMDIPAAGGTTSGLGMCTYHGSVKWATKLTLSGEDSNAITGDVAEADELQFFSQMNQTREKRPAKLIQIDGEHGILYPPHSQVLSFAPDLAASESVGLRIPGETLLEGMFVIMPIVEDVDFGGLQAELGHYSQIWKTRLEQEWLIDADGLIRRLREAGLTLTHLYSAIRHWCKPPSTVIHAPQQVKHFEILLQVLGVGDDSNTKHRHQRGSFLQLAWNEIRRSRGEAIQMGVQEHELVEEQLVVVLRMLVPDISRMASSGDGFHLAIPSEYGMKGDFLFLRVCGIEEGFNVPETELRIVRDLNMIDQWHD